MDEWATIMPDFYKNIAVPKREEGIGHAQDPAARSP
jgi:hypothetical protein